MTKLVRTLERADFDPVLDLMLEFSKESGVDSYDRTDYDRTAAKMILLRCQTGGISFVAQVDNRIVGMLLSICESDLWMPKIKRIRELAWYITPEYRNTRLGPFLYLEYVRQAERQRELKRITSYTMTKLRNSPDFDYERKGFRHIESTYVRGE
jgi:GNAT superfamily N-acetyltransferase